jgi:DDE superfamily endonuclease
VRPGREHDTTAARTDPDLLALIAAWVSDGAAWPGRPGVRRRTRHLHHPVQETQGGELTVDQQAHNAVHGALRCLGERANSLLKTTFKALRRYRGRPWRLGTIIGAALVLLHHENHRTT